MYECNTVLVKSAIQVFDFAVLHGRINEFIQALLEDHYIISFI